MEITLTVPANTDNKVRADLIQDTIKSNLEWWKDRERSHMLSEGDLDVYEQKLMHQALAAAGWAVWRDKYRDHYLPVVYISKRMPDYGIPAA